MRCAHTPYPHDRFRQYRPPVPQHPRARLGSGLPVTKRRVQYIQDKIAGGGGGGTGGGHKNDPSYAKKRESAKHGDPGTTTAGNGNDGTSSPARPVPAVKKVSRGAIHGGGGPAQGKARGAADRRAQRGGGQEEEEAGADFLAELRERFAVDKEELAGDADLDLLADDVLFAAVPAASADGDFSRQEEEDDDDEEEEGEAEAATASPEGIEVEGGSTASGKGGGDGGVVEQAEELPDNGVLLEEIKTMKVCDGQHAAFG